MSIEILEQLENKVQMAVDTISLLQLEIEELKEKNKNLGQESNAFKENRDELEQENERMRVDHEGWQERIRNLLGKIEEIEQ